MQECAADSVVILLVGNKIDLEPDVHAGSRVSPEHGRTLAAVRERERERRIDRNSKNKHACTHKRTQAQIHVHMHRPFCA